MRSKSFMAVAGSLFVLFALAGGMFLYDSGRKDQIAKGVSVGGVDVGGLTREEAQALLSEELVGPLKQPLVAEWRQRRFTLTPQTAKVTVDVDASVQDAINASRSANIVFRTFRGLTGGSVNEDVDVNVQYDAQAVSALVKRVRERLDRPAVNADVEISSAGVEKVSSQKGLEVDTVALSRTVRRRLIAVDAPREVKIEATKTKPKVTTKELAKEYPAVIVVNRSSFTLSLYEKLKNTKDYTVAIGAAGYDTPTGLYEIQNKAVNPAWSVPNSAWAGSLAGSVVPGGAANNPLKSRWMGIYNGAGIHGTDATYSLGSAASHGCVRMAIPDVEDLYDRVDVGTPVFIG